MVKRKVEIAMAMGPMLADAPCITLGDIDEGLTFAPRLDILFQETPYSVEDEKLDDDCPWKLWHVPRKLKLLYLSTTKERENHLRRGVMKKIRKGEMKDISSFSDFNHSAAQIQPRLFEDDMAAIPASKSEPSVKEMQRKEMQRRFRLLSTQAEKSNWKPEECAQQFKDMPTTTCHLWLQSYLHKDIHF